MKANPLFATIAHILAKVILRLASAKNIKKEMVENVFSQNHNSKNVRNNKNTRYHKQLVKL